MYRTRCVRGRVLVSGQVVSRGASCSFPRGQRSTFLMTETRQTHTMSVTRGPMNSPKVVISLALTLIFSAFFTACSGISSNNSATTPPPGSPMIETVLLPQGAVGVRYVAALSAIGGKTPYTWSVVDGS